MKTLNVILLSGVVLALAGCGNQGGSTDPYDTESGATSNTNYNPRSATNDYQGSAMSPGRSDVGVIRSTNYPGLGANNQFNTGSGAASNTNYERRSVTNDYQGSARSPDRINTGVGYGTNYPANDQGGATNSYKNGGQSIDPQRTNNVPEN